MDYVRPLYLLNSRNSCLCYQLVGMGDQLHKDSASVVVRFLAAESFTAFDIVICTQVPKPSPFGDLCP